MMKPTYYYTLYPDTFLWINETEGVMYNAKEHTYLSFDIHGLIKKYCLMLNELRNLYTIDVSPEDWEDTDLRSWMLDTVENKMGCLIEYSDTESRPISFPPLLNLQSDVDRIEKEKGREVGEYVAYNWNELSLFLGGQSEHPDYCRQFLYPIADEHFLDIQTLETFLATANNTYLLQVNVIGDILQYPYKKQLMCLLGGLTAKVCLYMLGDNAKGIGDLLNSSEFDKDKYELKLYYAGQKSCDEINRMLADSSISFSWRYIILGESDIEEMEEMKQNNVNVEIIPCPAFTGDNLDFFEQYIYTCKEDITVCSYDKKDIFAHQVMNSNYWGRLSVVPDGSVYSNINNPPVGTIKDTIYDLIIKEMKNRSAWRLTRDVTPECAKCLHRYLCPPPSNYGFVIGKFNLCHLK